MALDGFPCCAAGGDAPRIDAVSRTRPCESVTKIRQAGGKINGLHQGAITMSQEPMPLMKPRGGRNFVNLLHESMHFISLYCSPRSVHSF